MAGAHPFALAISESAWLFPVIEGRHILALPISVGMIVIVDLHLLGLAFREGSPSAIMREMLALLVPWWVGRDERLPSCP
jgi:hypothetical protein